METLDYIWKCNISYPYLHQDYILELLTRRPQSFNTMSSEQDGHLKITYETWEGETSLRFSLMLWIRPRNMLKRNARLKARKSLLSSTVVLRWPYQVCNASIYWKEGEILGP